MDDPILFQPADDSACRFGCGCCHIRQILTGEGHLNQQAKLVILLTELSRRPVPNPANARTSGRRPHSEVAVAGGLGSSCLEVGAMYGTQGACGRTMPNRLGSAGRRPGG